MPWIVKPCKQCNLEFRSSSWKGHEQQFCSNKCRQIHLVNSQPEKFSFIHKGKRISQCRECRKDFWKRHLDKFFCNTECYLTWKRKQIPRLICCMCGKEYLKNKKVKQKKVFTCSEECNKAYYYEIKKICRTPRFQKSESAKIHGPNCEKCGHDNYVDCHHIDKNRENNPLDGSNWMRLCRRCHKTTHVLSKKKGKMLTREEIMTTNYEA